MTTAKQIAHRAAQALDALYALQLPEEIYRRRVFITPPEA